VVAEPLYRRVDGPEGAPVVVLSHALGSSFEMWQRVLTPLATRYRVLRCDTRGHGRSPAPPGPYAIADLVADQLGLLDTLGIDRASFVGLSMGGAVCMLLAATAPERVDRLVLCSTAEKFGGPAGWLERAATVRDQGTEALADGTMERWFTPEFALREPDAVERIREIFTATDAEGYAACCEAIAAWDFAHRLGEIAAPTMVVGGRRDPTVVPERSQALAAAIRGAALAIIPDAAHLTAVSHPQELATAVLAHLG
jgi:3-oxoadipate enol-lactonase